MLPNKLDIEFNRLDVYSSLSSVRIMEVNFSIAPTAIIMNPFQQARLPINTIIILASDQRDDNLHCYEVM